MPLVRANRPKVIAATGIRAAGPRGLCLTTPRNGSYDPVVPFPAVARRRQTDPLSPLAPAARPRPMHRQPRREKETMARATVRAPRLARTLVLTVGLLVLG